MGKVTLIAGVRAPGGVPAMLWQLCIIKEDPPARRSHRPLGCQVSSWGRGGTGSSNHPGGGSVWIPGGLPHPQTFIHLPMESSVQASTPLAGPASPLSSAEWDSPSACEGELSPNRDTLGVLWNWKCWRRNWLSPLSQRAMFLQQLGVHTPGRPRLPLVMRGPTSAALGV